jgi:hypothetical protein
MRPSAGSSASRSTSADEDVIETRERLAGRTRRVVQQRPLGQSPRIRARSLHGSSRRAAVRSERQLAARGDHGAGGQNKRFSAAVSSGYR